MGMHKRLSRRCTNVGKYEEEKGYIDENPDAVILVRDADGSIREVVADDA